MAAVSSYLALGVVALFTVRAARGARLRRARSCRCICVTRSTHIVPMTVGFANYFALRLFRRRLYQDHYESPIAHRAERACPEKVLQ